MTSTITPPLKGIRVVELTHTILGPSCGMILADLGAEVIKVESPASGDFTRGLVPWVFQTVNRNKQSFAVDLREAEGRDLVLQLAARSDVFVQSMRPGVVEGMGLGRDAIKAVNPRIIHASLSGWGPSGPRSLDKGMDVVAQAESGLGFIQGTVLSTGSFVDAATGLAFAHAITAAILKRERTGEIDDITACLLDTAVYLASVPIAEYAATGFAFEPVAYARRFPTVGVFDAADGRLFVAAYRDAEWRAVSEVVGRPDLLDDPRFATKEAQADNLDALRAELQAAFATRSRDEWVRLLTARDVMAAQVRTTAEVPHLDQVVHNGSLEQLTISDGRVAPFSRPPYRIVGAPLPDSRPAPVIGADTARVLELLGIDAAGADKLRATGVVGDAHATD